MSMLDESVIRRIMRTRLSSVTHLPPESHLAWENHSFDPPSFDASEPISDVLWVQEWQEILSEIKSSTGLIEAIGLTVWGVYTPKGRGTRGADDLSRTIAESFEAGRSLTGYNESTTVILERTSRGPYRSGGKGLDGWIFKPVTTRWRVFTPVTS